MKQITLSNAQIVALLNADEIGGRIPRITQANVLRALARRGLVTNGSHPSRMTDDGHEVVRQCIGHGGRRTFTLDREK